MQAGSYCGESQCGGGCTQVIAYNDCDDNVQRAVWTYKGGHEKKSACPKACPIRTSDADPLNELEAKYGDRGDGKGFSHSEKKIVSIVFRARGRPIWTFLEQVGFASR